MADREERGMAARRRPTIADIAARAGVSSGAVSYALNGRPGVSDETRARVLRVADEIGWVPSTAARALSGVGAATIGLVITREPSMLGVEPFFMSFVAGIESVLPAEGFALLLHVTPHVDREIATYRTWWSARRVDGVLLTDLRVDDPRLGALQEIGLPAVVVGEPPACGGVSAVSSDDAGAASRAVRRLAELGHRRIAHVAGPQSLVHTQVRAAALRETAAALGLAVTPPVHTDYTLDLGADAVRALLTGAGTRAEAGGHAGRPTAIVFDNDLTALAGVQVARELGLDVPRDLSVIAWDDSPLCRLSTPPVAALSRDVAAYGADAARALLAVVRGGEPTLQRTSVPTLVERDSLAPLAG